MHLKCHIYGSYQTDLWLPWSDIDIVVECTDQRDPLDLINKALSKRKWIETIDVIRTASVPVIKMVCTKEYDSKNVDFTIWGPLHNGRECAQLVQEYLDYYPVLRPLVLVLKTYLRNLNLNNTYQVKILP